MVDESAIKRHWHLTVFSVPAAGHTSTVSLYLASKKRLITVPEINAGRANRKIPDESVITNIAYLGFGTQYEFTGTSAVKPPSNTSVAYHQGLAASLAPVPAVNPHKDEYSASEWELGHAAGHRAKSTPPSVLTPLIGKE